MNQLFAGIALTVLGIILFVANYRATKSQNENAFQSPYMKNAGIGFVFFGIYFLLKYLLN
jgi:hypothetical protein